VVIIPVTGMTDAELYLRGARTLVASWDAIARGSREARLVRAEGVAAAVFPHEPERSVYNNALLDRGADGDAVDAMEAAYAAAEVERFAAWVHQSDEAMRRELAARGYAVRESTRAMGMEVGALRITRPQLDLAPPDWREYVAYLERVGVPEGLLARVDPAAFELLLARQGGEIVATALGYDHGGDRGIYNVSTLEHARRRGLGSGLTARLVHDAADRGCRTASLQATELAERVYAAVGFRDLGRFLEYGP
jgi:ribosomal protein S18 acetylase RimI-like enzyme